MSFELGVARANIFTNVIILRTQEVLSYASLNYFLFIYRNDNSIEPFLKVLSHLNKECYTFIEPFLKNLCCITK